MAFCGAKDGLGLTDAKGCKTKQNGQTLGYQATEWT